MTKIVLNVELHDDRMKTKVMKAVSKLPGVESVSVDMKNKTLTLTGDIDPVTVVDKLRKLCHTQIVTVGPAKEPEKKKKEEPKKEKPKEDGKKKEPTENWDHLLRASEFYHYQMRHPYYCRSTVEEDPNGCVIC